MTEYCYHGEMDYRSGVSADGRTYSGHVCVERACKTRWETQRGRCRDLQWNPGFDLLWEAPSDCCDCPEIIQWGSPNPVGVACQRPKPVCPGCGSTLNSDVFGSYCSTCYIRKQEASKECDCYISPWGGRVPLQECPVHRWEMDLAHDPMPVPESKADDEKALRYGALAAGSFMTGLIATPLFLNVFHIEWAAWVSLGLGFILAQVFATKGDNA